MDFSIQYLLEITRLSIYRSRTFQTLFSSGFTRLVKGHLYRKSPLLQRPGSDFLFAVKKKKP